MNKSFEELNPVVLKKGFETSKKIAVIMNKLLLGQFPERIIERTDNDLIYFTKDVFTSSFRNNPNTSYGIYSSKYNSPTVMKSDIAISFKRDDAEFCTLYIDVNDQLFKVIYKTEIFTDPNQNNNVGLLNHIKQDSRYQIIAKSFLRYNKDELNDTYIIKNADSFYSYLKFFEENINHRVMKLCQIQEFNNNSNNITLNIADFCKLCNKGILEDNSLPSKITVKKFIDNLLYMRDSRVEKIQSGILRIIKTFGEFGTYRMYLGGAVICNEYSVSRFKYEFHPGIQLVAKYLESNKKEETLKYKIEKELFKRI